jgi:cytochrome c-type biogenesis protein CcmH/NrfG
VLARDPDQPDALAPAGWLEFEAGAAARNPAVVSDAQQLEDKAVRAAPGTYAPHLYLGSMLLAEGDATGALGQYRQFLADRPPPEVVMAAQKVIVQASHDAGQPVPAMPS